MLVQYVALCRFVRADHGLEIGILVRCIGRVVRAMFAGAR
jgi:hypothetical protein